MKKKEERREGILSERVDISVTLSGKKLGWPGPGNFASAAGNREFVDLSKATWKNVREVLETEEAFLKELAASAKPGTPLVELPPDDNEDLALADLPPTDLGTCAATLALNAARCPTITACAGHVTGYPFIAFWARPAWVALLSDAARAAGVGIGNAHHGAAEVFTNADDILGLLRLARELEARAKSFRRLK